MSTLYLELDSTYRDRSEYPIPADFVAPIALSASKGPAYALDPVSLAAPSSLVFTSPFAQLTGIIESYTTPPASSGVVLRIPSAQGASKIANYYAGVVIQFNDGTNNIYLRIYTWTYLQTVIVAAVSYDLFAVTFLFSNDVGIMAPGAVTFTITDPSSFFSPGDTAHPVFFIPASPFTGNYYTGQFIFNETRDQWITLGDYDWQSHLVQATLQATDNYTAGTWLSGDVLFVRAAIPVQYGHTLAGITSTTMTIANTLMTYVGSFIRMDSTATPPNQMSRIVAFDPTTSVATVAPGFSATPSGAYEILQFSYDNASKIFFNFSEVSSQTATCYGITLLNLVVPNKVLKTSPGGLPIFYPYLYVSLSTVSRAEGAGRNMIASNNPNSTRQLFRVLVNDSSNEIVSPVLRLNGSGMVQHVKIQPQDSFHFSVYLPDGELFETEIQDTTSPMAPNQFAQISAMFQMERISGN